ncbi:MAG TPA: excinuclease ABC subunit A, partial [Clostridiales bacterium]|nr:excinuclease ABC subunit A [Clostridiales bacterium]
MDEKLVVIGAKENNLKNISVTLPRNKFIVFTGVSGSGKSTLAFDTIFAEGERKFMESLSSYARQFLGQMEKPNVTRIDGLSPCIAIDQKTTSQNPRSTVGTITEIYDYFRLLFANIGRPYCPNCNRIIEKQSIDQIMNSVLSYGDGTKIVISSPMVVGKKGAFASDFEKLRKSGYSKVNVDGKILSLDDDIVLDKNKKHDISVVIDRVILKPESYSRIAESIETALKLSDGKAVVSHDDKEELYSNKFACPECGFSFSEISPRLFSFNTPYGACKTCAGLGIKKEIDANLVIGDRRRSLREGACTVSGWNLSSSDFTKVYFNALSKYYGFSLDTPFKDLSKDIQNMILYGNNGEELEIEYKSGTFVGSYIKSFEGVIPNLERRFRTTTSEYTKQEISKYMKDMPCEGCHGQRLNREALSVKIGDKNIFEVTDMSIAKIKEFLSNVELTEEQKIIAKDVLKEINARLDFLLNVGLDYLTLTRSASTLSGGEAQRIRLATQIGSGLVGVLYVLDEPSIGLHQRDNLKLIATLKNLRDLGNTLIVVEHDEDTIRNADYIVDIGPYAGVHGGEVVAEGTFQQILKSKKSLTAKYLRKELEIPIPSARRKGNGNYLEVIGAKQNNLKNINVKFPLGELICITGVSGSGKSSLVNEILFPALSNRLNGSKLTEGKYDDILGLEYVDKVICIDQTPIGRTPRSNP